VTPFVLLTLSASLTAWARVYFYAVVAVGASLALFASPAKQHLRRRLELRATPPPTTGKPAARVPLSRTPSTDSTREPFFGLSEDPEREVGDMVREIRTEVGRRRAAAAAAAGKAG